MRESLFDSNGVHCLVDGQFGSTGKGAFAAKMAELAAKYDIYFHGAIYSGGPNSGHTFYHDGEKHVCKQLPVFSVATSLIGGEVCPAYLSAGAIIDPAILFEEARRYPNVPIYVHPCAAVVNDAAREMEKLSGAPKIASTMSGTGGALMRKIARFPDAVWKGNQFPDQPSNIVTTDHFLHPEDYRYFMEVAQGFSLGINNHLFYPHTTSRECTVTQGLADTGLSVHHLVRTYMSIRTFPIRVGNTPEGNSGEWYPDQEEIDWETLGVEPELTTVTKRIRRVATFSRYQFEDALRANAPDFVFVNFLNYLKLETGAQDEFIRDIAEIRDGAEKWFDIIGGYGPESDHIRIID